MDQPHFRWQDRSLKDRLWPLSAGLRWISDPKPWKRGMGGSGDKKRTTVATTVPAPNCLLIVALMCVSFSAPGDSDADQAMSSSLYTKTRRASLHAAARPDALSSARLSPSGPQDDHATHTQADAVREHPQLHEETGGTYLISHLASAMIHRPSIADMIFILGCEFRPEPRGFESPTITESLDTIDCPIHPHSPPTLYNEARQQDQLNKWTKALTNPLIRETSSH